MHRKIALPTAIAISLIAALTPARAKAPSELCLPPNPASGSPARCTFDLWGYVTDIDGSPVEGARIRDDASGRTVFSDSSGFYDLYEPKPDAYWIAAKYTFPDGRFCQRSSLAWVGVEAAALGGQRWDWQIACQIS